MEAARLKAITEARIDFIFLGQGKARKEATRGVKDKGMVRGKEWLFCPSYLPNETKRITHGIEDSQPYVDHGERSSHLPRANSLQK